MIRNDIKQISAYPVPERDGMIRLDAMESPYGLPDTLRAEWLKTLAEVEINRYPDSGMRDLRERLAERENVAPEQILIGNGSDEIIQMLLIAAEPGTCVFPQPTFVMYELISRWLRRPTASMPLERDFSLSAEQFLKLCAREKASIAFLACPNNPTGNLWPEETVRRIAEGFRGLLILDEAYAPFSERSHVGLVSEHVAVLRTFSKIGWAGLRFGYLIGEARFVEHLNKVRLPYNVNALTQASARLFLRHFDVFEEQARCIRAERGRVTAALMALEKVTVFPSQANFVLVRVPGADEVFEHLLARGILVKNLSRAGGLLSDTLRITIGTREENDRLLAALKEVLE